MIRAGGPDVHDIATLPSDGQEALLVPVASGGLQ